MERLRLGLLNLKEDGNGISTGDRLHGVMDADLRILCSSSFPFQAEKMFFSWETLPNSASQNTSLSKTHTVGQAVLDKS